MEEQKIRSIDQKMTDIEKKCAEALMNCPMLPGSLDKKFVNQLATYNDRDMKHSARDRMHTLLRKYRRHIPDYYRLSKELNKQIDTNGIQ